MNRQHQTIELRNDTVEQLIDLLENIDCDGRTVGDIIRRERREIVAAKLRDQYDAPDAIALCGLPGAGKSLVAEQLADVYDAVVVTMGDAIRKKYEEEHGEEPDSDTLGDFAAEWRADDPQGIPKKVTEIAKRYYEGIGRFHSQQSDLIIIDGVRSPTDHGYLSQYFSDFTLVEVEADFYTRLDRLQTRGREGEQKFQPTDLANRDERELFELGFERTKQNGTIDIVMENNKNRDELVLNLSKLVENNLDHEIENGKPLGLNDELERKRNVMAGGGPVEDNPEGVDLEAGDLPPHSNSV